MKRHYRHARNELRGIWDFCMGSKSSLNLFGKIVLFPLWLWIVCLFFLIAFLFEKPKT